MWLEKGQFHFPLLSPLDCVDLLYANATYPFYKNKMGKRSFFLSYKKKKKRDDFLLPKSSLFFLKPWMNGQKISRILFVHPLKICEQYGFIQSIHLQTGITLITKTKPLQKTKKCLKELSKSL